MKVLILTSPTFNPVELWGCIDELKIHDISYKVCSTKSVIHEEKRADRKVKIHGKIYEFLKRTEEFDALIIISGGGPEMSQYFWHDPITLNIVDRLSKKLLAAICTGVPSLRKYTNDVKFTCWPSDEVVRLMTLHGGIHEKLSVIWDKNTVGGWNVTAENEVATRIWTRTIIELLQGKEPSLKQKFAFDVVKLKQTTRRRKVRDEIKAKKEGRKDGKI